PDSPTSASVSPASTLKETPSTARTTPDAIPNSERRTTKCLVTFSSDNSGIALMPTHRLFSLSPCLVGRASVRGAGATCNAACDRRPPRTASHAQDGARGGNSNPGDHHSCHQSLQRCSPAARQAAHANGGERRWLGTAACLGERTPAGETAAGKASSKRRHA